MESMQNFDARLSSSALNPLASRTYIVGSLGENPKSILKVADYTYEVNDPVKAVDIMFKIHLSMNLQFPRQSLAVWSFIDKYFYKLNLQICNSSQVITIENEMNIFACS